MEQKYHKILPSYVRVVDFSCSRYNILNQCYKLTYNKLKFVNKSTGRTFFSDSYRIEEVYEDEDKILDTKVEMTIIGGEIVYSRN